MTTEASEVKVIQGGFGQRQSRATRLRNLESFAEARAAQIDARKTAMDQAQVGDDLDPGKEEGPIVEQLRDSGTEVARSRVRRASTGNFLIKDLIVDGVPPAVLAASGLVGFEYGTSQTVFSTRVHTHEDPMIISAMPIRKRAGEKRRPAGHAL